MSHNKVINTLNLLVFLSLSASFFACTNLMQYGARYPRNNEELVVGLPPSSQMISELNDTRQARSTLLGRKELANRYARCMYFRNQLVVAADYSRGEWSLDAHEVNKAAEEIERAYQKSDSEFLRICEAHLATPLGKTFADYWPESLPKTATKPARTKNPKAALSDDET